MNLPFNNKILKYAQYLHSGKQQILVLYFYCSILMAFLMTLSVILLSMLMILLSILSVIKHLTCCNNLKWLLNLNLIYMIYETLSVD